MTKIRLSLTALLFVTAFPAFAEETPAMKHSNPGSSMKMDLDGAVMNENHEKLPQDCQQRGPDYNFTVHAGRKYAKEFPEYVYAYDQREWNVEPCSRITVTMINDDSVRHQFMLHGLPMYLYHQGMFHMEVNGGKQKTGTFIVPSTKRTYFVHCDMSQHTEKGLRGQLKVNGGNGDLVSIPGISALAIPDPYDVQWDWMHLVILGIAALAGLGIAYGLLQRLIMENGAVPVESKQ